MKDEEQEALGIVLPEPDPAGMVHLYDENGKFKGASSCSCEVCGCPVVSAPPGAKRCPPCIGVVLPSPDTRAVDVAARGRDLLKRVEFVNYSWLSEIYKSADAFHANPTPLMKDLGFGRDRGVKVRSLDQIVGYERPPAKMFTAGEITFNGFKLKQLDGIDLDLDLNSTGGTVSSNDNPPLSMQDLVDAAARMFGPPGIDMAPVYDLSPRMDPIEVPRPWSGEQIGWIDLKPSAHDLGFVDEIDRQRALMVPGLPHAMMGVDLGNVVCMVPMPTRPMVEFTIEVPIAQRAGLTAMLDMFSKRRSPRKQKQSAIKQQIAYWAARRLRPIDPQKWPAMRAMQSVERDDEVDDQILQDRRDDWTVNCEHTLRVLKLPPRCGEGHFDSKNTDVPCKTCGQPMVADIMSAIVFQRHTDNGSSIGICTVCEDDSFMLYDVEAVARDIENGPCPLRNLRKGTARQRRVLQQQRWQAARKFRAECRRNPPKY